MTKTGEGYIKFNIDHVFQDIKMPSALFEEISFWRTKLFDLQLIGELPNGIGYGNISVKYEEGFFITGSATGAIRELGKEGYSYVHNYDLGKNEVESRGRTKASSESLSHAAVYECRAAVRTVIHVHSKDIWERCKHKLPTTSSEIAYGTPEMAFAMQRLIQEDSNFEQGTIIMGGHEDGIVTFGKNMEQAGTKLLNL